MKLNEKKCFKYLIFFLMSFFCNYINAQLPCELNGTSGETVGAGKDQMICTNQSISLGNSGNDCFDVKWKSIPNDPSLSGHEEEGQPVVSPNKTTKYILTIKDLETSEECIFEVSVVVIENIILETTEEDIFVMDDLEVMEGRQINFLATVDAVIPSDFDLEENPCTFIFEYQYENQVWLAREHIVIALKNGVLQKNDMHITADVPNGDFDHFHNLSVKVSMKTANNIICTDVNARIDDIFVYELWAQKFRDKITGKNWQVVVGSDIEFEAISAFTCSNFTWAFIESDGSDIVWSLNGAMSQSGTNAKIPVSKLPTNDKYNYFGDTYSTFKLSCEDGEGRRLEVFSNQKEPWMLPEMNQEVNIFFVKDEINPNTLTSNKEPNWFYYWKAFLPTGDIEHLIYTDTITLADGTPLPSAYGATLAEPKATWISKLASQQSSEINDHNLSNSRGIHTFYETLIHEDHHITIWKDIWWSSSSNDDTYIPIFDDDQDRYKDTWEMSEETLLWNFALNQNDAYTGGVSQSSCPPFVASVHCLGGSAGHKYEEYYCRKKQRALMINAYDHLDWSFDPTLINQGKQW